MQVLTCVARGPDLPRLQEISLRRLGAVGDRVTGGIEKHGQPPLSGRD